MEILNRYLYFYECEPQVDSVSVKYLGGLIALIKTNMANIDRNDASAAGVIAFYDNTINHIQLQRAAQNPRFMALEINASDSATTSK